MDEKIVIIGMGNLMTLIAPSYVSLLGDRLKDDLIATTVDEEDRKRRQQMFPFRIQLGDNAGALRKLKPTMILFAPPPAVAAGIAESDLAPYYSEVRAEGERLPLLLATPPVPSVDKYYEILGEDIAAVTLIPNTFTEIAGKKVEKEGMSMVTMSDSHPLSEKDRERVLALLEPMGEVLFSKPQYGLKTLTAGVVLTSVARYILDISEAADGEYTPMQIAAGSRFAHRRYSHVFHGGDIPEADVLPEWLMTALGDFIAAYTEGLKDYMKDVNDPDTDVIRIMGDMNLHMCMMQDRAQTEASLASMATPGGMLEKALKDYDKYMKEKMIAEARTLYREHSFTHDFLECLREHVRRTCHAVMEHTLGLSK